MTPIKHLPVIFVSGVPGAGNQTVAQTISNITGYTLIRPGELVRSEAERDTPRGQLIADKLRAQEDIPDVCNLRCCLRKHFMIINICILIITKYFTHCTHLVFDLIPSISNS